MENQEKIEWQELSEYDFEFRFIPMLIREACNNLTSIYEIMVALSDVEWILNKRIPAHKFTCSFCIEEFDSSPFMIDKNAVTIYNFPKPICAALAKYGAIVYNPTNGIKYFTLEKFEYKDKHGWILGQVTSKAHFNHGEVRDCSSPEEFISVLKSKGFIVKDGFFAKLKMKIIKFFEPDEEDEG